MCSLVLQVAKVKKTDYFSKTIFTNKDKGLYLTNVVLCILV